MSGHKLVAKLAILLLFYASFCVAPYLSANTYAQGPIPVQGAEVWAVGEGGGGFAVSDSLGFYNITSFLETGTYTVHSSAPGLMDSFLFDVNVTAGAETTNVSILMPVSGGISGKITDAVSGLPLQNVVVTPINPVSGDWFGYPAVTDSNGNYQINSNLETGTCNVTASDAPGYIKKTSGVVSVTAGAVTNNVNIALSRPATISGTVKDSVSSAVLQNIVLQVVASDGTYVTGAATNSSGQYVLNTDLATGTYNITAQYPPNHLDKTVSGVAVVAGSQYVKDMSLDPSGIISGRITSATGQPISDVYVTAASNGFHGFGGTNDSGYYRLTDGLGSGIYTVSAFYGPGVNQTTGVIVTQGSETKNVNLQITLSSGTISGKVVDSTGNPIQGAVVSASGGLSGGGQDYTDINGDYAINSGLGTGTYSVNATARGFATMVRTGVSVVVNQVTSSVNFQLGVKPSGRISGRVLAVSTPIPEIPTIPMLLGLFVAVTIAVFAIKTLKMRPLKPL